MESTALFCKEIFCSGYCFVRRRRPLTQSLNVNAEPFDVKKSIRLNVTNETLQEKKGVVSWQLRDPAGKVLEEREEEITVDALSAKWLEKIDMHEAKLYENYVSFQFKMDGRVVSCGTVLFCAP